MSGQTINEHTEDKAQKYYGSVTHWITIVCCLVALIAPVFILLFPDANMLNPNQVFGAIFRGNTSDEIWATTGMSFQFGDFWRILISNILRPDGIASLFIAIGCSVTMWAMLPATSTFIKRKEYFYAGVSAVIIALVALAMSGLI